MTKKKRRRFALDQKVNIVESWTTPIVHAFDRRIQEVMEPETISTAQETVIKGCTQVVPLGMKTKT